MSATEVGPRDDYAVIAQVAALVAQAAELLGTIKPPTE